MDKRIYETKDRQRLMDKSTYETKDWQRIMDKCTYIKQKTGRG